MYLIITQWEVINYWNLKQIIKIKNMSFFFLKGVQEGYQPIFSGQSYIFKMII